MPSSTSAGRAGARRQDAVRPIVEHDAPIDCNQCGAGMKQVITGSYAVLGDIPDYRNMIDGKTVSGRRAHREFLKRNNVVEYGHTGEH